MKKVITAVVMAVVATMLSGCISIGNDKQISNEYINNGCDVDDTIRLFKNYYANTRKKEFAFINDNSNRFINDCVNDSKYKSNVVKNNPIKGAKEFDNSWLGRAVIPLSIQLQKGEMK